MDVDLYGLLTISTVRLVRRAFEFEGRNKGMNTPYTNGMKLMQIIVRKRYLFGGQM